MRLSVLSDHWNRVVHPHWVVEVGVTVGQGGTVPLKISNINWRWQ